MGQQPENPPRPASTAGSPFPSTRWTLIERAASSDPKTGSSALSEIVRLYAPALRAHLLQITGRDEHRAEDLLQGFLADKVLEQRLIGFADPARGKFRTFLLTALDRYVIDTYRHDTARKRMPAGTVEQIEAQIESLAQPDSTDSSRAAFDVAFAREVVDETLATMRHQCEVSNRSDLWDVFEVRYLKPAMENVPPEPHESIASRLKLESPHQAGNLLITAKRMFTRMFKGVVSRYALDESEVRDEVSELWRLFAGSRL